jgi:hypothetical protein
LFDYILISKRTMLISFSKLVETHQILEGESEEEAIFHAQGVAHCKEQPSSVM